MSAWQPLQPHAQFGWRAINSFAANAIGGWVSNRRITQIIRCRDHKTTAVAPWLAVAAVAGMAVMPAPAKAQTPAPLQEWQYSAGVPLEKLMEPQIPTWQVAVGAAAAFQPRYDGADRYHFEGGPSVDIRYSDLYFASTGEGFGANVAAGPELADQSCRRLRSRTARPGRRRASARPRQHQPCTGTEAGGRLRRVQGLPAGATRRHPSQFRRLQRLDRRYWRVYAAAGQLENVLLVCRPKPDVRRFEVHEQLVRCQRAAGRGFPIPAYHASAGLKSAGFGVSAIWFFQKHWFAACDFALEQLVGSAARSPITQRASNGVLDLSINYQF